MSRVLVTGGAGFIGSHTCIALLEKGYDVKVIDSLVNSSYKSLKRVEKILLSNNINVQDKLSFLNCDLRNLNDIEKVFKESKNEGKPISSVIHFAGLKAVNESLKTPLDYWDANVKGTINLLKIMDKNYCKKIVFSSSATIYGVKEDSYIDESSEISPSNPYGSTKVVVEKILSDLFNSDPKGWYILNLRYFNPIGAHPSGLIGESPHGIPSNIFPTITQVASGKLNELSIYGKDWPTFDGTCIRDYIHVMDLAEGHIAALQYLEKNETQIKNLNLGTGKGTSIIQLLDTFQRVNNIKIPHKFCDRRKGDIAHVVADNSLAKKYLNWIPKRNLEDMCKDGWKWQFMNQNGFV